MVRERPAIAIYADIAHARHLQLVFFLMNLEIRIHGKPVKNILESRHNVLLRLPAGL